MNACIARLCGIIALSLLGMSARAAEPKESATAGPLLQPVAFAGCIDYLDGPRHEAMGAHIGRKASNDTAGNWFILCKHSTNKLRCIRLDTGLIETIVGDNRWASDLNIEEGPAVYFPNMRDVPLAGDQSVLNVGISVYGLPLKGEDFGAIYVYGMKRRPYKIFKNKEKKDRWWFKPLGTIGKAKPPTKTGDTAKVIDTDFANARIGEGWITWKGNLYSFDYKEQTITCVLSVADYQSRVNAALKKAGEKMKGGAMKVADRLILSSDGNMYVMHPWRDGKVFKISADLKKFEYIVQHNWDVKGWNLDGPGLYTTWHCGPSYIKTTGDTLMLRAIDSATVRRYINGRVSVLCMDGQWRETSSKSKRKKIKHVYGMGYKPADHGLPYIYIHYPGGGGMGNDLRVFRFGPVNFTKPTVGPLAQMPVIDKKGKK